MHNDKNKAIIFFDGGCKLCNGSVRFIFDRDHQKYFKYIALQSDEAKMILAGYGDNIEDLDSVLLITNGRVLAKSTAVLTIARYLSGMWPLLYGFIFVPKFIRDPVYNLITKKRQKWFDRMNTIIEKDE